MINKQTFVEHSLLFKICKMFSCTISHVIYNSMQVCTKAKIRETQSKKSAKFAQKCPWSQLSRALANPSQAARSRKISPPTWEACPPCLWGRVQKSWRRRLTSWRLAVAKSRQRINMRSSILNPTCESWWQRRLVYFILSPIFTLNSYWNV